MENIPMPIKVILWIFFFPIMLIAFLATKITENSPGESAENLKELIMENRCPNCGREMQVSLQNGQTYYACPKYCLSYVVKTLPKYYKSNYFDERESEKRFKITEPYIYDYNVKTRHYDSDVGGMRGAVTPDRAKKITEAFDALRTRTLVDLPITEEAFKDAIEGGKKLIHDKCPLCDTLIMKKTAFVKGYGDTVTKMVRTGYGEYTFKNEYVGTYDQNVVSYTCGCGIKYRLSENEIDGMYYKRYSTDNDLDALQRACAFSEICTSKRTWFSRVD